MKFIHLKELRERYNQAIGYYRPTEDELNRMQAKRNPFPRRVDNELGFCMDSDFTKAAFAGQLRFYGAPETGGKHDLGGGQSLTPPQDIPAQYFSVERGFYESKITSFSDLQPGNTWHETLHENPRHPNYVNVLVYDDGLENFLSTLKHFASDLPGTKAAIPNVTELTLCEALTFLAFGHRVQRERIAEHLDPTFQEREILIERLFAIRKLNPVYSHLPDSFSSECFFIVDQLMDSRVAQPWPDELTNLQKLGVAGVEKTMADGSLLAKSIAAFTQGARDGQFACKGSLQGTTIPVDIPVSVFRRHLTLNWLFDTVGPFDIFDPNNISEYENVTIEASHFFNWVTSLGSGPVENDEKKSSSIAAQNTDNQIVARKPKLAQTEADKFMKDRCNKWSVGSAYPNEREDWQAMKENFPDHDVPRIVLRGARKGLPISWNNQGPKKTRAQKAPLK